MNINKITFLVYLALLITMPLSGQEYFAKAEWFGVAHGLPHRQVNSILQDKAGFIWVATEAGVARFDGLRFKIFNKADNGLSAESLHSILEDASGNLWLISLDNYLREINSVDILDPVSGLVTSLDKYIPDLPPVPLANLHGGFSSFTAIDSSGKTKPGTLFFGTLNPGGWVSWHPDQGWERVISDEIAGLEILSLTPQHGILGIVKDPRLVDLLMVELDSKGKVIRYIKGTEGNRFHRLFGNAKNPERFFAMEVDEKSGQSFYWEIKAGEDKTPLSLSLPQLRGKLLERALLLELGQGNLWLSEHDIFNDKGEILLDLLSQFPGINNRFISNFLRDRSGGIWLGNSFGLEHIEVRKDNFRRFLFDKSWQDGAGHPCRGILQVGNSLWVNTEGTMGGLYGINLATGHVFFEQNSGRNYGLALGKEGSVWSGQDRGPEAHGELARFDLASGEICNTISFDPVILWTVFPTESGQLWCGTYKGLLFIDPVTEKVSQPDTANFPELKSADVYHIARDGSGSVWICSSTGFYKISDNGRILERYWSQGKGDHWLPYDNFYHFYQDSEGVFWLGTAGGGLLRWDPKSGEKRLLSRTSGLLSNFVYAVYEDDFGHLWLPTNLGIAQFDKKSLSVRRTWGPEDGVTQNEFNRISHFKNADGTLYFGGLNGVTAFHPRDFYGNSNGYETVNVQTNNRMDSSSSRKNLMLTDFNLFSGSSNRLEKQTADLLSSGKITIQPNDRYFQLEFALLDYFSPKKATYYYMIEGIDRDWNILQEPMLRLSGLPPGSHLLKIRAESAEGIRAENELEYELTVLLPVFLRWWFLLLVAGLLFLAGFLFYRFQLNRRLAEKEAQRLQHLDAFKTRFYTNISHEFRTPLTVILGMADTMRAGTDKEREKSAEMVRRNSRQLLNLVNQLLDLSRVESGKLKLSPTNGDLVTFLRFQLESFHSYAQTLGIRLHFKGDVDHFSMAFDHDKIQTILVNLISNAIKFTPSGGEIVLDLHTNINMDSKHPTEVIFELKDTGVGIPKDHIERIFDRFYQVDDSNTRIGEGSGIGLALVQELVKLMQGEITVASSPGEGTSFRISLPYAPPSIQLSTESGVHNLAADYSFLVPDEREETFDDDDNRPLLLVVEDNPDVRYYITECVRDEYRFSLAANGIEGIQKALDTVPDIIISDVMMPEKDGFFLCETLKNDEVTSHIPIILLTARADFESRISGLTKGADAYLAKPFEPTELKAHLANLIKIRQKLHQRYSGLTDLPSKVEDLEMEIEDAFLAKIREVVEANLQEENFEVPELGRALAMSRSQLFRKVKALTGSSPSVLIRTIRLQKAKELIANKELSISEVAYQVGFSSPTYFSTAFTELFGKTPSDWRKS